MAAMIQQDNQEEFNPMLMDLPQLSDTKTRLESEMNELGQQIELLAQARQKFMSATATVTEIQKFPANNRQLVPINTSLYVPGKILTTEKLLVELGTGYYCEKSAPDALKVIERKSALVADSISQIERVGYEKRMQLEQVINVMKYKASQGQQQQQQ